MAEKQPARDASVRALPQRPSIEWLKKTAKERLDSLRAHAPTAKLADAQLEVAREYGFASWRALSAHIESLQPAPAAKIDDGEGLKKKFRDAVTNHRLQELRECLNQDRSLANAPVFAFGQRPIGAAHGDGATIDLLISYGADINLKSDWWAGPWGVLDMADEATAEVLIARGAVVDIFAATHLNRLDRMHELLSADPPLVHAKGGDGCRPLHFAKSVEAIDLLLSLGAEIDARDVDHESTAAQWAMPRPTQEYPRNPKHEQAVQRINWLIERGASVDIFMLAAIGDADRLRKLLRDDPGAMDARVGAKNYPPCPDAPGRHIYVYPLNEGRSAFEIATAFGNQACVDLLIAGSSPRQRFLAACAIGDEVNARKALRENPRLVEELTPEEQNALPNAAWAGNGEAVRLMLDLGFNPMAAAGHSGTALHGAAWHGRARIVKMILDHPAVLRRIADVIEIKEETFHSTPFGWCCHGSANCRNPAGDYAAVAELLLDAGATVGANYGDASEEVKGVIAKRSS